MIKGSNIVLGVSGSIACYKAVDLVSKLVQEGANVFVIMTSGAQEFVTPLTFQSITHMPVVTSLYDTNSEFAIKHVSLAEKTDVIIVAPATAKVLAKAALGISDDALTATILASKAPLIFAPAMDGDMWASAATQSNVSVLKKRALFVGPDSGRLASGQIGTGRLADTQTIIGAIKTVLGRNGDLEGKSIVVSAGGTQESIDPVRLLTNRSTGKMGYAVAEAARDRGASVTLVAGPTSLPDPYGVTVKHVTTVDEMRNAIRAACAKCDALVMAAAVGDYKVTSPAKQKIKRGAGKLTLNLTPTADIIGELKGDFVKIGFAAETQDLTGNAKKKLASKKLDMIVANDITEAGSGFGTDTNRVTIISRDGKAQRLPLLTKYEVGRRILDKLIPLFEGD